MAQRPLDPDFLLEKFYQDLLTQHNIPPAELLKLFKKHELDPGLIQKLFSTVLNRHRSLVWGKKAELKRELERIVDDSLRED